MPFAENGTSPIHKTLIMEFNEIFRPSVGADVSALDALLNIPIKK